MIEDIKSQYTAEHQKKSSTHLYPTEWVVRTMLGEYPNLKFDKSYFSRGRVLDMGFGDGRNFSLFNNIGLEIFGVEITQEIIDLVKTKFNFNLNLAIGTNINIPFGNNFFDIIVACSSFYYVDKGSRFDDNLREYTRVLKPNGILIANFPELYKNFICKDAINLGDNHIIIQNDIHNLRNGYVFRAFESKNEIISTLSPYFNNICVGYLYDDYYGYQLSGYIVVAKKK